MLLLNIKQVKENYLFYAKIKKVYAVIKSNAYGFGIKKIYKTLKKAGCNYFSVIDINEAIYLRKLDKKINILLLSDFDYNDLKKIIKNKIILTISSLEKFDKIYNLNNKIKIELKIDTGMHRFGLSKNEYNAIIEKLKDKPNIKLLGVYTHMATNKSNFFYDYQFNNFKSLKINQNIDIHVSSSFGYLYDNYTNTLRIGYGLYKNSIYLYGKIIKIFKLKALEGLGYDLKYKANNDKLVAIVNIGYYDGLSRNFSNLYAYLNNKYVKIIGNICMNHCFILVDKSAKINDQVEFIGDHIKLEEIAKNLKTTPHEIIINLNKSNIKYI